MREFTTTDGWTLKSAADSRDQIWYREEPPAGPDQPPTHSFRTEGFIDAPLFNLLALIYEFDLFPKWFPLLKKARTVATPSKFCKFAQLVAWAPWPMCDRECMLRGYGDIFNGDSVAIFATDATPADSDGLGFALPPEGEDGSCRINVHVAGFHLVPVSDGRVLVRCFFNLDVKIAFLPEFMLNIIVGKFCGALLHLVRKHASPARMAGSVYEQRIQADIASGSGVYNEMKRRLGTLTAEAKAANVARYATPRQREVLASLPTL